MPGAVLSLLGPLWALHSLLRGRGFAAPPALPPKCTQSWVSPGRHQHLGTSQGTGSDDPTHPLHFVSVFPEAEHHLPHPQKPWGGPGCGTTRSPTRQCAYDPCPHCFPPTPSQPWGRMEMATASARPDPSSAGQGCRPPYGTFRARPKCWSAGPPRLAGLS